ncbi:MAG: mechanosensitive ion channel family protein [bacterium]|nr:MAG: mechanosensitive ion channel family protein [bacterium]
MIGKIHFGLLVLFSLYFGSLILELPVSLKTIMNKLIVVGFLLQGAIWGTGLIQFWVERYKKKRLAEDAASVTTFTALGFVLRLILWSVFLLLILDNLGVDITALVAGLGVGGIAVALAVQNILGDLFASLSIVLDKPFVIGDFIIVDNYLGSVEHIGLKTTRLRSLTGEQLVMSNSDLLKSRIRNFKRMYERRVLFTLGVTYQTSLENIRQIPAMIKEIVESQENVRFDRAHFKEYGNFSLNFEVVYWVKSPDYNTYMDIQQAINLQIFKQFEENSIEFAYPTQTLFVSKVDESQNSPAD